MVALAITRTATTKRTRSASILAAQATTRMEMMRRTRSFLTLADLVTTSEYPCAIPGPRNSTNHLKGETRTTRRTTKLLSLARFFGWGFRLASKQPHQQGPQHCFLLLYNNSIFLVSAFCICERQADRSKLIMGHRQISQDNIDRRLEGGRLLISNRRQQDD